MKSVWDYDVKDLKKSEKGKIKLLERMVNFGPDGNEKILLSDVKKYWDKLSLFPNRKRLMELLIWKKTLPSTNTK